LGRPLVGISFKFNCLVFQLSRVARSPVRRPVEAGRKTDYLSGSVM
jgi:hypothetical protein